jgi:tetratricopeptide (TPR) repeat protein
MGGRSFIALPEERKMSKSRKEKLEELLELDPNDSFVRYGLAMEHAGAGQDDEAVRHLRELIQRDADYVPAYLQAGRALIRLAEDDDAREILRAGITVATRTGDDHAAGEMTGFLESLG